MNPHADDDILGLMSDRRRPGTFDGDYGFENGTAIRHLGDGLCGHSCMKTFFEHDISAESLRQQMCNLITKNPNRKLSGTAISEWIKPEDVQTYVKRTLGGRWAGGLEFSLFSDEYDCNVFIYVKAKHGGYRSTHCFSARNAKKTIHLLYNAVHYDIFVPAGDLVCVAEFGWQFAGPKKKAESGASIRHKRKWTDQLGSSHAQQQQRNQ
jgi:hypothetical protein